MDYDKMMEKAREKNKEMDRIETNAGFASPEKCDISQHIRTAMSAIECGIRIADFDCVAEGQAMLENVLRRIP